MYTKNRENTNSSNESLVEIQQIFAQRNFYNGEMLYVSTSKRVKQTQPNQIREALEKGYVEMSHINLMICSECLHAEYEAEHMVEQRLVSGG
ncbi:hypothetical protein [Bacillus ndiopicus]|uniref:hypothetical protein n=1 Tax=Bacillus ndiopicus TaxID=1347368 RepID=UPI0005A9DC44